MNIEAISKRVAGSTELFLRKHGPEILTGVGVVGFAATTYFVGKAVLKAQEPIEEFRKGRQEISNKQVNEQYTEKDKAREMGQYAIIEGFKIARIFVPATALGAASVFSVVAAHGMMQRKQTALVAAYTALDAGFRAYRQRVQEELGVEKERELYRRPAMRAIDQVEEGEEAEYAVDREAARPSMYGRFFDELNPNFQKTPEWNLQFLVSTQNWANDQLEAYGFVFLNDVYVALGLERSQAGQVVGWKTKKLGGVDGYVDFGIYDESNEVNRAFINGYDPMCFVDFNVDGPITI